ncbi:MAG: sigma-70 family RNA polymerase sigma factor [Planctomycetota bacterium]|nr:sigma-70 family RNA polymerase sigma factor [Planctomycetota bacterium]
MHDEDALLARARAGDREAFAALAAAHREAVYRAAWWILRDQDDSLDVTQEALLRAFRFLPGFDGRASFRTWARRIATNVALDRQARRRRDRADALPEEDVVSDPRDEAVGEALERDERRRLVREAIETLPPAQRAAVLLRDVEGLSYEEIAGALEIPRGTVMSRLFYGRATLKKRLAWLFGGEPARAGGQEDAA